MRTMAAASSNKGSLDKQRIARPGEGKSGGYRCIILFRRGQRSIFVYGFAKNDVGNIDQSDERDFKELARVLLFASDTELERLIGSGKYFEVNCDDQVQGGQEEPL